MRASPNICVQAPYDLDPADWAGGDQRTFYERFLVFKERLAKRFRRPKKSGGGGVQGGE